MSDTNTEAKISSFWSSIFNSKIEIPRLQREYAQGRDDDNVRIIREQLIQSFFNALKTGETLNLNFIYGEKKNDNFVPIDGQQRLTALFLLHWYIFMRSGKYGVDKLKNFSYSTRDSSKQMCDNLCNNERNKVNFNEESISSQIKDKSWFSNNLNMDPSVKSMLVVLDSIHAKFKDEPDENIINFANMLTAENAENSPITFLHLDMDNFKNTSDLYIKMNARGKVLTDFEIFKANLQNSEILSEEWTDSKDYNTDEKRVDFISKFNNYYIELFYKYFPENFDPAIMRFLMSVFRNDYFAEVSSLNVPQKTYREYFVGFYKKNANAFYKFLIDDDPIRDWKFNENAREKLHKTVGKSVLKADKLLNVLYELFYRETGETKERVPDDKDYSGNLNLDDETILIRSIYSEDDTLAVETARYALYEYIFKFGYPNIDDKQAVNAYKAWKRVVFNLVNNSEFSNSYEACEDMRVFRELAGKIDKSEGSVSEGKILETVANYEGFMPAELKYQFAEERIKAKNILADEAIRELILEIEDYFKDGQIKFLIDLSLDNYIDEDNFTIQDDNKVLVDADKLKKAFEISKKLFKKDKTAQENYIPNQLERALLCVSAEVDANHLIKSKNASDCMNFCDGNYKRFLANRTAKSIDINLIEDYRNILNGLFVKIAANGMDNITESLKKIIENTDPKIFNSNHLWKKYYVDDDLIGQIEIRSDNNPDSIKFGKNLHLKMCDSHNSPILLLKATTTGSYSMEFYTALLGRKFPENKVIYNLYTGKDNINDDNGFPYRYFEYDGIKVGFKNHNDNQDLKSGKLPGHFVYKRGDSEDFESLKADNLDDAKKELEEILK